MWRQLSSQLRLPFKKCSEGSPSRCILKKNAATSGKEATSAEWAGECDDPESSEGEGYC